MRYLEVGVEIRSAAMRAVLSVFQIRQKPHDPPERTPANTHTCAHTKKTQKQTNINSLAGVASVTSGRSDRRDPVSGGGRLIDVTPLPASILLDG